MPDSSLRTAIERALDRQIVDEVCARRIHIEVRSGGWAALELRLADAVLAIFNDPPAWLVEGVASLMYVQANDDGWPSPDPAKSMIYVERARTVLAAMTGGEQS